MFLNQVQTGFYTDSLGNNAWVSATPTAAGAVATYHVPLNNGEAIIQFQTGDPKIHKRNGLTNEVLLAIVLHHIAQQNKVLGSSHNLKAMEHIEAAMAYLDARTLCRTIGSGFSGAL
jgi:hypothetical protein